MKKMDRRRFGNIRLVPTMTTPLALPASVQQALLESCELELLDMPNHPPSPMPPEREIREAIAVLHTMQAADMRLISMDCDGSLPKNRWHDVEVAALRYERHRCDLDRLHGFLRMLIASE